MLRVFRTRALGRAMAVIVLLCAVAALQPMSHGHAAPATHGQHDGHDHGPGGHAGGNHGGAAVPDSCCHPAVSGCGGAAFLPAGDAAEAVAWQRSLLRFDHAAGGLSGRTTVPEPHPPRASS